MRDHMFTGETLTPALRTTSSNNLERQSLQKSSYNRPFKTKGTVTFAVKNMSRNPLSLNDDEYLESAADFRASRQSLTIQCPRKTRCFCVTRSVDYYIIPKHTVRVSAYWTTQEEVHSEQQQQQQPDWVCRRRRR